MSIVQPRLRYTARDFEAIRQQIITLIQTTEGLKDKWSDFNESDLGMVFMELLSALLEELGFFIDMQANEAYLLTARQRKNIVSLCKLIAYKLDTVVSAEGIATFTWVGTNNIALPPEAVLIPKYTRLATSGTQVVQFVTTVGATLPAGSQSIDVPIRQGVLREEEFQSVGTPHQQFVLDNLAIASNFGAIEVLVGQGTNLTQYIEWVEASNFIINSPEDNQNRFTVETNHMDQITIKFGDGRFGAIPGDGFKIVVRYLVSAGPDGNTGSNTVNNLVDRLIDITGVPVSISVSNIETCIGGTARETIEHAKRQAPQELASLGRAVTRLDGTALIDGLAGIAKAKVWGEQELPHPDKNHFNQMYVTFVGDGIDPEFDDPTSWLPTTALKNLVLGYIEDKKIITTRVYFVEPEVVFIDLQLDAHIAKTASLLTVKQAVLDKLDEFFHIDSQNFGEDLRYSQLLAAIDEVPNVEYARLKIKRSGTPPDVPSTPDVLGLDPNADVAQWSFDEQDIICRRHEFIALNAVIAADTTSSITRFAKDDEPIRAQINMFPQYAKKGEVITFDGTGSSSPNGTIVTYQWNMGARGVLMQRAVNGTLIEAITQPSDGQTVISNFDNTGNNYSSLVWKYLERPATGLTLINLTVIDQTNKFAYFTLAYEVVE